MSKLIIVHHKNKLSNLLQILCQGRRDNPIHEVAFNELIENLKKRNTIWSNTMPDCERSVTRTLFMDENSDRNH